MMIPKLLKWRLQPCSSIKINYSTSLLLIQRKINQGDIDGGLLYIKNNKNSIDKSLLVQIIEACSYSSKLDRIIDFLEDNTLSISQEILERILITSLITQNTDITHRVSNVLRRADTVHSSRNFLHILTATSMIRNVSFLHEYSSPQNICNLFVTNPRDSISPHVMEGVMYIWINNYDLSKISDFLYFIGSLPGRIVIPLRRQCLLKCLSLLHFRKGQANQYSDLVAFLAHRVQNSAILLTNQSHPHSLKQVCLLVSALNQNTPAEVAEIRSLLHFYWRSIYPKRQLWGWASVMVDAQKILESLQYGGSASKHDLGKRFFEECHLKGVPMSFLAYVYAMQFHFPHVLQLKHLENTASTDKTHLKVEFSPAISSILSLAYKDPTMTATVTATPPDPGVRPSASGTDASDTKVFSAKNNARTNAKSSAHIRNKQRYFLDGLHSSLFVITSRSLLKSQTGTETEIASGGAVSPETNMSPRSLHDQPLAPLASVMDTMDASVVSEIVLNKIRDHYGMYS